MVSLKALFVTLLASPSAAFTVGGVSSSGSSTRLAASVDTQDDLLKPAYDVEPIPIRIGHGFDIHRMAPIEVAGQPVIIGGVEITHKDQKVGLIQNCIRMGVPSGLTISFMPTKHCLTLFFLFKSGRMRKELMWKREESMKLNWELLPTRMEMWSITPLSTQFLVP